MKPVILIDLENVKTVDLEKFPGDASVYVFTGDDQNKIDFTMVTRAQKLGDRLEWVKIKGKGKNALDFYIAYFLGTLTSEKHDSAYFIFSKDKGFDPLVAYLSEKGIRCKRIESEAGAANSGKPPAKIHAVQNKTVNGNIPKAKKVPLESAPAAGNNPQAKKAPASPQAKTETFSKIQDSLQKLQDDKRPKTSGGLRAFIMNRDRLLTEEQAFQILNRLSQSGVIVETNNRISYAAKK